MTATNIKVGNKYKYRVLNEHEDSRAWYGFPVAPPLNRKGYIIQKKGWIFWGRFERWSRFERVRFETIEEAVNYIRVMLGENDPISLKVV